MFFKSLKWRKDFPGAQLFFLYPLYKHIPWQKTRGLRLSSLLNVFVNHKLKVNILLIINMHIIVRDFRPMDFFLLKFEKRKCLLLSVKKNSDCNTWFKIILRLCSLKMWISLHCRSWITTLNTHFFWQLLIVKLLD